MEAAKAFTISFCIFAGYMQLVCCYPANIAQPCNDDICKLPDCFCSGTKIPGGLNPKDVPQMVMISFDDAVNIQNFKYYELLLNSGYSARKNPNGKYKVLFSRLFWVHFLVTLHVKVTRMWHCHTYHGRRGYYW